VVDSNFCWKGWTETGRSAKLFLVEGDPLRYRSKTTNLLYWYKAYLNQQRKNENDNQDQESRNKHPEHWQPRSDWLVDREN
jgi:hypothetical protein